MGESVQARADRNTERLFRTASCAGLIMNFSRGLIAAVALSAVSVAFLWLTEIPLGIPGEWAWERISPDDAGAEVLLGAVQAMIAAMVYLLVAWLGSRRIGTCSRSEGTGWLIGMALMGFGWLLAVQESPPAGWRLSKSVFVLYYPGSSGYFHKTRHELSDTAEFLGGYEDLMDEGDVLHVGTHPPGLFLFYRTLIDQLESRPELAQFIERSAPESVLEAFDVLDGNLRRSGQELTTTDRAVLWSATVMTLWCCAVTVIPVFFLVRQMHGRETAWRTAVFWPLLPALAIFIPKSDVLFTLPAALLVLTWLVAAKRQSFFLGVFAGIIGWCGLFCSLAFLPIGLVALLASLLISARLSADDGSADGSVRTAAVRMLLPLPLWRPVLGGVIAVFGLTFVVAQAYGMNLLNVWIHNYHNHAAFYSQYSRTVWKWWLVNPFELILAAGVPVICLAARASCRLLTSGRNGMLCQRPLLVSVLLVWVLLWLSGKNSGEAARLWCPLLPLLLAVSADGSGRADVSSELASSEHMTGDSEWLVLLGCQAIVCTATVLRVSGFHF